MKRNGNPWTTDEDNIVLDVLRKEIPLGKNFTQCFAIAEPYLPERNAAAIATRWANALKKNNQDIVEMAKNTESPDKYSEWNAEEDYKVAQTVLEKVAKGETLTSIYEGLETVLENRTAAAIAFRWTNVLKKVFFDEYEEALKKKQKLKVKRLGKTTQVKVKKTQPQQPIQESLKLEETTKVEPEQPVVEVKKSIVTPEDFKEVSDFMGKITEVITENSALKRELAQLKSDKSTLEMKVERLEREAQTMEEDYKSILVLMDKARKLMLSEEEKAAKVAQTPGRFKMDRNGNLERY